SATNSRMSFANRRSLAVIKKMEANHIERSLGSLHTNHVAIPDEADRTFSYAGWAGNGYVNRADRLFVGAAAGSCDSGDAHAQRAAYSAANALGQRYGHLGADGAFCCDQFTGNVGPRCFQFVAVADHTSEKISRAAGDIGQALGEQAA